MEIQPQVDRALLTHESLIKLTKDYHNYVCEDEMCIIYEKKLPAIKVQLAPIVGITVSTLRFDKDFYSRFSYDQNMNPSFGIQVNTLLPRVYERVSIQLEVLYNNNDFYGIYNEYYELYINNSMLQTSLAIRYNFPKGKIRPSLAVGVVADFLLDIDIHAVVNSNPGNPPHETRLDNINMKSKLFGGVIQLGCNYHIFKNREMFSNLKYSYCVGTDVSGNMPINTIINSLNLNVGVYLSKTE